MIQLRDYQKQAVSVMIRDMKYEGNSVLSLPVGAGKSIIIAEFAKRLGQDILILVPSKELLEQNLGKLQSLVNNDEIGVFSASINSKVVKKYTLATIGSIYKKPELFEHFEVAVIDEVQNFNPSKINTMYGKFFKSAGIKKVFGLSGTPFRQDVYYEYPQGYKGYQWQKRQIKAITTTKMLTRYKDSFFRKMLFAMDAHELQEQGYLSELKYHDVRVLSHYEIPTNKTKSDFDLEKFEQLMYSKLDRVAYLVNNLEHKRKLVFCASIEQAEDLCSLIDNSVVLTSETKKKERASIIKQFRAGEIETIVNVGILTTGFDVPELEVVILCRPTRSLALHLQILGRVCRIADGKEFGHVYDFVGNIESLGTLESVRTTKIDNKWNITTSAFEDGVHLKPLYEHIIKKN